MTVPGKGGRPRKWNSDADRIRAFRARERGDDEPATVQESLAQDDGSLVAWAQVQHLNEMIEKQQRTIGDLQRELANLRRSLSEEERRSGWVDVENKRLRARLADLQKLESPPPAPEPTLSDTSILNRAQRRRAQRKSRKLGR